MPGQISIGDLGQNYIGGNNASNRHWSVQICRVQAEPVDHGDPQPGLLEGGPALP